MKSLEAIHHNDSVKGTVAGYFADEQKYIALSCGDSHFLVVSWQ